MTCSVGSDEAQQGYFSLGYTATFETIGTDVTITFELLDEDRIGVGAYLWLQEPFTETPMENVSGLIFSKTIAEQTLDSSITYACKFEFQGGLSVTRYFSYVVGENCVNDTEAPTNFTASIGAVTAFSVEILLNGMDDSETVIYQVNYGEDSSAASGSSNVQKSLTISGLTAETPYTFNVQARDFLGNTAANNPIVLNATTAADTNTQCIGSSPGAQQGAFSIGYTYDFQTSGTDVTFTFELLDKDKDGVLAFLWEKTPFTETQLDHVSGLKFSKTLSGFTYGETINIACKFAFAGGQAVTKYFAYDVGNNCWPLSTAAYAFIESIKIYPNPVTNILHLQSPVEALSKVEIFSLDGRKIREYHTDLNTLNLEELYNGMYLILLHTEKGSTAQRLIKE